MHRCALRGSLAPWPCLYYCFIYVMFYYIMFYFTYCFKLDFDCSSFHTPNASLLETRSKALKTGLYDSPAKVLISILQSSSASMKAFSTFSCIEFLSFSSIASVFLPFLVLDVNVATVLVLAVFTVAFFAYELDCLLCFQKKRS